MLSSNSSSNLILKIQDQSYTPIISLKALYRCLIVLGLLFVLTIYTFFVHSSHHQFPSLVARIQEQWTPSPRSQQSPSYAITISDIVFGIAATVRTWKYKKPYIESWWQPNVTRGYVFFEEPPGLDSRPWPKTSPPYRVVHNVTKLDVFKKFPNEIQVRILQSILDTPKQGDENVKWFVFTDDDTVLVVENLVQVLGKYDHKKLMYVGMNSEAVKSNADFDFEMGYGGAGYALSAPLMKVVDEKLVGCIERYTHLVTSDHILSACLSDLGIDPNFERGMHQIDLHGDISGLLSAHPKAPFVSIHHLDTIDPIFPSKNRTESIHQLLQAAKMDHFRILQQTICHHRPNFWSFSIAWGYSLQIYESVFPRWLLKRPFETFMPWLTIAKPPYYMFNTRPLTDNPCEAPHQFFAESVERKKLGGEDDDDDKIVTTFVRRSARGLVACPLEGHKSADSIRKVKVISPTTRNTEDERDCCNVVKVGAREVEIRYRPCYKNEIIG